ncbi:MAG: hypothetical protein KJ622_14710 [Alphaproteobacteria bacterium]|nr:hypothetical protein [Alphaproteobacteria bacterium]
MMFQVFGSGEKSAARNEPSPSAVNESLLGEHTEAGDEVSLRLERELAVVLARKPKHRWIAADALADDSDDETPIVFDTAANSSSEQSDVNQAAQEESADDIAPASNPPPQKIVSTSHHGGTAERWRKSTRINRRSHFFRKSASVAITFAVTAFIISIVAAILFGLPDGLRKLTSSNDRTALITTRSVGTIPVTAAPAPARMQWVSK